MARRPLSDRHWEVLDNISPPKKIREQDDDENTAPGDTELVLTHFTKPPYLSFGKVKVGSQKTASLNIRNPQVFPLKLTITKLPKTKGLEFESTCFQVEANSKKELKVTWIPEREGNIREMVGFRSNAGFPISFIILGTGIAVKKKKKTGNLPARHRSTMATPSVNLQSNEAKGTVDLNIQTIHVPVRNAFAPQSNDLQVLEEPDRRQTYSISRGNPCEDRCPLCGSVYSATKNATYTMKQTYCPPVQIPPPGIARALPTEKTKATLHQTIRRDTFTKSAPNEDDVDNILVCSSKACHYRLSANLQAPPISSTSNEQTTDYGRLWQIDSNQQGQLLSLPQVIIEEENFEDSLEKISPVRPDESQITTHDLLEVKHQNTSRTCFEPSLEGVTSTPCEPIPVTAYDFEAPPAFIGDNKTKFPLNLLGTWQKGLKPTETPMTITLDKPPHHQAKRSLTFSVANRNADQTGRDSVVESQYQEPENVKTYEGEGQNDGMPFQKQVENVQNLKKMYCTRLLIQIEPCEEPHHREATVIQAAVRGWLTRKHLGAEKNILVKVQRQVQANIAANRERTQFLALKRSTIKIQSFYRMVRARREYLAMKKAAITLQQRRHAQRIFREDFHRFQIMKMAAIKLQAHVRGFLVRKHLAKQHCAAIVIQSYWRRYAAFCTFNSKKINAIKIQQWFRKTLEMKKQRGCFKAIRASAVIIQRYFRGYSARKKFIEQKKAVRTIEIYWSCLMKTRKLRQEFLHKKSTAITIQAAWRAKRQRRHYLILRKSVILIQSCFKGFIVRKKHHCQKKAVHTIEKYWSSFMQARSARQDFISKKNAVVVIQAFWRMHRDQQQFLKMKKSAVVIQRHFRGFVARCNYRRQKRAVCTIEKYWSSFVQASIVRKDFIQKRNAIVAIQSYWRMHRERQRYIRIKKSAVIIQRHFRGFIVRRNYCLQRASVIIIQQFWARNKEARKARKGFIAMKKAAVTIQAMWRMFRQRKLYFQMRNSSILIQSWYRGIVARKESHRKKAAVTIETFWVRTVQAKKIRKEFLSAKKAATVIQASWRMVKERRRYLQLKAECLAESQRKYAAATVIQAAWRASRDRRQPPNDRLADIRRRLTMATASATPENQMITRTRVSLKHLTKYRLISSVILDLGTLCSSSSLLPSLCHEIASKENITALCHVTEGTNRSVTDVEIVIKSLTILLNLAKLEETLECVWNDGKTYPVILKLLQIHAGSNAIICRKALFLLHFFSRKMEWTKIMKQNPQAIRILQNTSSAIRRRERMEKRRKMRKQPPYVFASSSRCGAQRDIPTALENRLPDWAGQRAELSENKILEDVFSAFDIPL